MANSTQTVVSDGSLALLDISFDYLFRSEITVYFDSVLTVNWAWVGVSDKQITFDPVVPAGVTVLVKRTTSIAALLHEFSLGAAFTTTSLDQDLKQVLHIAQEASEASFIGDFYTPINMHGNRITHVAEAVDPTDVPSFGQLSVYSDLAAVAAAAAAAAYDSFDDRYLGPKELDPTLDNDGNALLLGAMYWNSAVGAMRTWDGAVWASSPWTADAAYADDGVAGSIFTTVQGFVTKVLSSIGASIVGFVQAGLGAVVRSAEDKLREHVSVKDYGAVGDGTTDDTAAILAAANAVSAAGGGTVFFPIGRYRVTGMSYSTNYLDTDNVAFVGEKMPVLSDNADRLEGGSVICGGFYAFAHNFTVRDIGFDLGKFEMDTNYASFDSLTSNRPVSGGGTAGWDAFSFVRPGALYSITQAKNFIADNVICLLSRPGSYGHAFITENINGGFADNVVGVYGIHAVVLKNENMQIGSIAGYMALTDNVIIKSDSFAPCGDLQIGQVIAKRDYPNVTPWSAPADTTYGLFINPATADMSGPIQIGRLITDNCSRAMLVRGGAAYNADKIQVGTAHVKNASVVAIGADTCAFREIQIGLLNADVVGTGVASNLTNSTYATYPKFTVQSCQLLNVANWAVQASGYARVKIDMLEVKVAGYGYYCENNARIMVGKEELAGVVSKWYTSGLDPAPARSVSYSDAAGYHGFTIALENYGVRVSGVLRYDGGGTPTENATLLTLPTYLRPPLALLLPSVSRSGTTYSSVGLSVTSGGSVAFNEGNSLPTVNDVVACNLSWTHY